MLCLWSRWVPGDPSGVALVHHCQVRKSGAVLGPVPSICARVYVLSVLPVHGHLLLLHPLLFPLIRSCPTPGSPLASPETSSRTHPLFNHSSISHSLSTCAGQVHGRPWGKEDAWIFIPVHKETVGAGGHVSVWWSSAPPDLYSGWRLGKGAKGDSRRGVPV